MIFNEVGAKSLFRQDVISSVEPCHYRGSSVVGNPDNMISIIKHCLEEKIQKLRGHVGCFFSTLTKDVLID